MSPRTRSAAFGLIAILGFAGGCKNPNLVEAELRWQTNKLEDLESQNHMKDAEIETLRATVDSLRGELQQRGSTAPPETIYQSTGLSTITIGPLSGGRDFNRDGKDDALQVVIVPHDYDADVFKCPGTATVDAYEFTQSGAKRPLGRWEIDQNQLKTGWRSTVLSQGYQVVLPWKELPKNNKLRVVVHFQTLDGRQFEAERDLTVSLKEKEGAKTAAAPDLIETPEADGTVIRDKPASHTAHKPKAGWERDGQAPPWWSLPFQRPVPDDARSGGARMSAPKFKRSGPAVQLLPPVTAQK